MNRVSMADAKKKDWMQRHAVELEEAPGITYIHSTEAILLERMAVLAQTTDYLESPP